MSQEEKYKGAEKTEVGGRGMVYCLRKMYKSLNDIFRAMRYFR